MQFSFTSEQEEFRSVLRRFLEEKSPPTVVRRLMGTEAGWDRKGWQELNEQLGLTAVHIPEAYGGQGFGFVELGIVLEEMGRALLCAPYFGSVVLAATAAQSELVVMAVQVTVALAVPLAAVVVVVVRAGAAYLAATAAMVAMVAMAASVLAVVVLATAVAHYSS